MTVSRDPAFVWALPRARPTGEPRGGWRRLLARGREERTLTLVARALNGAPHPVAEEFAAVHRAVLARAVVRRSAADRLAQAMPVEFLPLKGWSLERRVYREPGLRDMGDLDLLVRPADAPAAAGAMERLGYRLLGRVGGVTPFRNSVEATREGGPPVHLHWHPLNASLPIGLAVPRLRQDEIWSHARSGQIDAEQEVVLLAEHAVRHSMRPLSTVVDVAWALDAGASAEGAAAWARRWGMAFPLYACLRLLEDAGMAVDAAPLARSVRGLDGRGFLRAVRRGRRWHGLNGLAYLSMCRGVRGRFAFVARSFAPPTEAARSFGKRADAGLIWRRLRRAVEMFSGG